MGKGNVEHNTRNMQPIISIRNLVAGYDGKPQITDVNLDIFNREFVGITGPNGGGKTTLLKVMTGLLKPMEGTVVRSIGLRIGYLPQYNALDKQFPISVRDAVLSGFNGELGVFGKLQAEHYAMLDVTLKRFMLNDLATRPLRALSGGELQRVMMARAIISCPDVIVLDEPHTYIDEAFGNELNNILADELRHSTVIMVSHNLEDIRKMATKHIHVDTAVTVLS